MNTRRVVTIGLFAALCFAATYIHIPVPLGGINGIIHLGTAVIYVSAALIGKDAGWVGAIGCAFFDLTDSAAWAIPTFIIKGLQGYTAGKITFMRGKKGSSFVQNLIAFTSGSVVSLIGYFLADWLIFYGWNTAMIMTLPSLITSALGIIFSMIIVSALKPFIKKSNMSL